MPQQYKVGKHATKIYVEGYYTVVKYHDTEVVKFNEEEIILDNGGYKTPTTKTRMNQASSEFNLDYHVWQSKGEWFVLDCEGKKIPFDGTKLTLKRKHLMDNKIRFRGGSGLMTSLRKWNDE